jgi:hypothetical protein
MNPHRVFRSTAAVAIAFGGALSAHALLAGCASSSQPPPGTEAQARSAAPAESGGRRHGPPPAAFDACKGKPVGEACTVQWHDGEIHGKCETPPPGAPQSGSVCRPEGKHPHHHGPPPEKVFAACDGKGAGDACSVAFERGTVEGSCMAPRWVDGGAGRLLCAPARGHKHHDGGT